MSSITDETYQALARYEALANMKLDLKLVGEIGGITAKAAWSRTDKARKAIRAQGSETAVPASAGATKKAAAAKSPTKKRTARGKRKNKEESEAEEAETAEDAAGDDEEEYGGGGKRFKRELSDGGMTVFAGKSDAEDEE